MSVFTVMRVIHVLAASLWVGGAVINAAFVVPAIMATGPAGGQVMRVIAQTRRLPVYMNAVMTTTLLTGIHLYWNASNGLSAGWIGSRTGMAFTIGAACALATAAIGFVVTIPSVKQIGALGAAMAAAGGPPSAESQVQMAALQRRLLGAAQLGSVLLVVAVIAMAVARYL